jgi:hypothetical protein
LRYVGSDALLLVLFVLLSFGVPLGLGLAIGRGRRRQLALVGAVAAFWSLLAVYVLGTSCSMGSECAAAALFFATFGVMSLVGVCAATLVRDDRVRPGPRIAVVVSLALLLVGAGAGYVHYGNEIIRWGCPTTADIERPWSVVEVVDAFEDADLPLEPATVPPVLPRPSGARAYRGAQAFSHRAGDATLHVVICRKRCSLFFPRPGRPVELRRQARLSRARWPNVVAVVIELDDPRAASQLRRELDGPLRELDRSVFYESRCWFR